MTQKEFFEVLLIRKSLLELTDILPNNNFSLVHDVLSELKSYFNKKYKGTKIKTTTYNGRVYYGSIVRYTITLSDSSFVLSTGHYRNYFDKNAEVISEEEYYDVYRDIK